MGLIRAALGSVGGVMGDQWRDYFYCEAIHADILMQRALRRTDPKSQNRGNEHIISNGSVIAVADGQAMAIVEQGAVVEFCAEPGEFIFDSSTEPSIFYGSLGKNLLTTFKNIGRRISFGGDTAKDQRIYYFNLKEITGNKYGTPNPIPFRVVDQNIGLDIDISVRANGKYSYRLTDPLLFYTNVAGNVAQAYRRDEIDAQLKAELLTALQPAFAKISAAGVRYSALPGHTKEVADALNDELSVQWGEQRGIGIEAFGIKSVTASPEDENMIKELQRKAVMRNADMAGAALVSAQADAMRTAAGNEGGAMMGFLGMNQAMQAGNNAGGFFQMDQMNKQQAANQQAAMAQGATQAHGWPCDCGSTNTGKFCSDCGKGQPTPPAGWTCACSAVNTGKFCSECGKGQPQDTSWKCECGSDNSGRFCGNCGKSQG